MSSRVHYGGGQQGLSVVELMVALVVGLIMMAGLTVIMVDSNRTYNVQDDFARLQENARFAIEFISRDIRMAGYFGCADDMTKVSNNLTNTVGDIYDVINPIEGFEQGQTDWKPSASTETISIINPNTDAITLRFANPSSRVPLASPMSATDEVISVADPAPFGDDAVLAIEDCDSVDIFQVSGVIAGNLSHAPGQSTPGNFSADLSKPYSNMAATNIMSLRSVRYFIADNAAGVPTLRRQIVTGSGAASAPEDVVEGIENMQLLYGEDTDGDRFPDVYREAQAVSIWRNVVTVQVGVLARSIDEYGAAHDNDAGTHTILTYDFVDTAKLQVNRKSFTTTVSLRNI